MSKGEKERELLEKLKKAAEELLKRRQTEKEKHVSKGYERKD